MRKALLTLAFICAMASGLSAQIEPLPGGGSPSAVTGSSGKWTVNSAGDFVPATNNTYSLGNGTLNPLDVTASRNLRVFSGTSTTIFAQFLKTATGLDVQSATVAPTALTGTIAAGAGVTAGTHSYKVTFVTAGGETEAGSVSNTVTTAAGNLQVNITALPVSDYPGVTSRKIYRTAAGNAITGPWLLQSTISDNTATTATDNVADGSLTTTAPTSNTAIDTRWTFNNTGQILGGDEVAATPTYSFINEATMGFFRGGASSLVLAGANTLSQRNGVTAQAFRVYNTFTDASNGEWMELSWAGNVASLTTVKNGSGTLRAATFNAAQLNFATAGSTRWFVSGNALSPAVTNTVDLGATNAAVKNAYIATSLQGSATKTLAETSATGFATVAIPNSGGCAGKAVYTVFAADATNTQLVSGELFFSAAATNAGVVTAATISDQHALNPVTSGTLTNTMTSTTGANLLTLLANATSSLTQTTLEVRYRIELQGGVCSVTGL